MKYFPLAITLLSFVLSPISIKTNAAEPTNNKSPVEGQSMASEQEPKMTFSVQHSLLEKNSSADSIDWIEIDAQKQLVLRRKGKGRKVRGNVILFHTIGENPDHRRIIQPLSIQLSNLGWNVLIPNIAISDFPEQLSATKVESETEIADSLSEDKNNNSEKTDSTTTQTINTVYFKTDIEYQSYFTSICSELVKLINPPESQTVIISNQLASYWSIDCLKQFQGKTAVVFLQPQSPRGLFTKLDPKLSQSNHPLFTFTQNSDTKEVMVSSIKNHKWGGLKQRFNSEILSNSILAIEDIRIAKSITGWIKSLESDSQ